MIDLNRIKEAIEEAAESGLISEETAVLTGFSGEKLVGMLQRIAKEKLSENDCYLEVGVFQGLTLLSVAKEIDNLEAYGIDNFAYFDKEGINHAIVTERIEKLGLQNVKIINQDYEDALENLSQRIGQKKVGLYFVDGPHDYRSQLMCLALIKPYLTKNAVIVVDDCNYRHVRQANRDFLITHPEFKLMFESYTDIHPLNLTESERKDHKKSWWNGVNVIVHDPENQLKPMYPPTYRDRTLYENEHAIHSTKHPEVVPYLLRITNLLAPIVYKFSKLSKKEKIMKGKHKTMNVYSGDLPKDNFNPAVKK